MDLGTDFVLLTGSRAVTLAGIVVIVYEVAAKGIVIDMLPSNDYVWARFEHDEGRLIKWLLKERIPRYEGVARGNSKTVTFDGRIALKKTEGCKPCC